MSDDRESALLYKGPCEDCGSSDACAVYDDGHTYCYSCGTYSGSDTVADNPTPTTGSRPKTPLVTVNQITAIPSRGLSEETCKRFGVGIGFAGGQSVLVSPYHDEAGRVVAQKLRTKDKDFSVTGDLKSARLFGAHLCGQGGRMVVITEGEIDAMSVDQAMQSPNGRRYGAVSVPNGAQGAAKAVAANLEWLNTFETVVLCFDMDDPGRKAVEDCVGMFPPGKVAVAQLPMKDANEMLLAGQATALSSAIWNAKPYSPAGIVTLDDIEDKVRTPPVRGFPWVFPELDAKAYGRRYGDLVGLGAGTGVGKTTFMTQQIAADLANGLSVGVFALEASPQDTMKHVLGQMAGKTFHIPDSGWMAGDLDRAINALRLPDMGELYLFDHFGTCDWPTIRERIRWLNKVHGVRVFYLDHLTALAAADAENERTVLEKIMGELGSLVKELDIWLLFVSHLTTPEKGAHEEGQRVAIRHFKGSRMIGAWSAFMIALERNQQADTEDERRMTTLRVLKDRFTGQALGLTLHLSYVVNTGRLEVTQPTYSSTMHDATMAGDEPF